jgi:hypothetical protein
MGKEKWIWSSWDPQCGDDVEWELESKMEQSLRGWA